MLTESGIIRDKRETLPMKHPAAYERLVRVARAREPAYHVALGAMVCGGRPYS